ncbi:hypothetical protein SKAU_G00346480 [Synaphobranchus kaupii]|uniref:Uncharacterized protein n=1 Tax=Synaphobranchus kaupii TaxID=118154 RepID=A0A9Q1EJU1_SYNKA|nr:hypothetical protein SKAU_G00346480 [Synaphobranchus kaupii]
MDDHSNIPVLRRAEGSMRIDTLPDVTVAEVPEEVMTKEINSLPLVVPRSPTPRRTALRTSGEPLPGSAWCERHLRCGGCDLSYLTPARLGGRADICLRDERVVITRARPRWASLLRRIKRRRCAPRANSETGRASARMATCCCCPLSGYGPEPGPEHKLVLIRLDPAELHGDRAQTGLGRTLELLRIDWLSDLKGEEV